MSIPTPHISAKQGDFAKTVLMPGDPLRSKFIAENFLENPVLVNNVRGVCGYTGTYKGKRVSVMASGMGIPSIGIYSHELFTFYDVESIIRIGSAGAMTDKLKLRDIVIAQGACTNSSFITQYVPFGSYAPIADYSLLSAAVEKAKEMKLPYVVGNILSTDNFYDRTGRETDWGKMGILAVEMEAAGLYTTAAYSGKKALAICTITDSLVTAESLPSAERRKSLTQMIELALAISD